MTSASSERQIAKRKAKAAQDAAATDLTIRTIMGSPIGRRWMWLQLEACGAFLANMHDDPMAAARQEGQRITGLRLLAEVTRYAPQAYITMTTENTGVQVAQPDSQEHDDNDDSE